MREGDKVPEGAPFGWTDDDWCTPPEVLERVRRVGPIGLDPCGYDGSVVGARVELRLDEGQDGLAVAWGSILLPGELAFVNPPYSRGRVERWVEKLGEEALAGVELVALVPANVETEQWQDVLWFADAVCFPRGRVRFMAGGRVQGTPRRANALAYFGPRVEAFRAAFEGFGAVVAPIINSSRGGRHADPQGDQRREPDVQPPRPLPGGDGEGAGLARAPVPGVREADGVPGEGAAVRPRAGEPRPAVLAPSPDDGYAAFLARKFSEAAPVGFEAEVESSHLFPFQRDLVRWALRRGRAAIFADTGLGKSRMEVEWARRIAARVGDDACVLVLAPLAVAAQTVREGASIGVPVTLCRDGADVRPGVNVTNYDRLHRFDPSRFVGVVLDESSCIKHFESRTLGQLKEAFADVRYRLCATATPAPNDHSELGTHAEFLGICSRGEMLSEFFVHDGSSTQDWRLKGHARAAFWRWVSSWGALVRRPSDLGYGDDGYLLPLLDVRRRLVEVPGLVVPEKFGLAERRAVRRGSIVERVAACAAAVNASPDEQWVVWGALNAETEALAAAIPGAVEVRGPDAPEDKERRLLDFADGKVRVVVSKASICGFGLNWQRCARMAFVGIDDSYESYYQAVRRCWRFGQARPVEVHLFATALDQAILDNLDRKAADAAAMADALSAETRDAVHAEVRGAAPMRDAYAPTKAIRLPKWGAAA